MVLLLTETVPVPKNLLRDLIAGLAKAEEALATIEELADEDGMERIRKAKAERRNGETTELRKGEDLLERA